MQKQQPEKGNAPEVAATEALSEANPYQKESNMSDSTQVAASRAITVPFHGADLCVVEHNGHPYTPMKPIVEGMGLTWHGQHRKLVQGYSRDENTSGRWGIVIMTIPLQSGAQDMLAMPLRKLPGWMSTLEPSRIKNQAVRARVEAYQNECDDVLWQYWNEGIAINPRASYSVNAGDALTKEEADTLRHMVEGMAKKLSSDTKAQGKFIMQAWSKLKAHFHVSYRQIPRQELTEAISIVNRHTVEWELVDDTPPAGTVNELIAEWVKKIEAPNGYPATLFEPIVEAVQRKTGKQPAQPDTSRMQAAFDAAAQAAAAVQKTVFNSVLSGNDEWRFGRWMLAFIDDSSKGSPAYARQMEQGAFVTTWPRLVRDVANGEAMCSSEELLQLASACIGRLEKRTAPAKLAG